MAPNLKEVKPLTESQHNSRLIRRKTNLKKKQKTTTITSFLYDCPEYIQTKININNENK